MKGQLIVRLFAFVSILSLLFGGLGIPTQHAQADSGVCGSDPTLVGCWPMEEGSGSVILDASSFGNNGTITGSPTWAPGRVGQALDLSGTGQYAVVPDHNSLDLTNAITLAAWVRPEKVATQNIIKKTTGTTTPNGYEISLSNPGKVFVRFNGNATYRVDSLTSYPTNGTTWLHVAATYDGTTIALYINGVLEGSKPGVAIGVNNTNVGIGAEPAATPINLFQGLIDDVRIYSRALSLSEIEALAGLAPTVRPLTVSKTGTGSGAVTSVPTGIDCGVTCAYDFAENTLVTLTASPSAGSTFTGWSGACSGTGSCQITMDAAKSIGAEFTSTPSSPGLTCTTLQPKPATTGTGEKPQSKVWQHAGAWWAVFPTNSAGASSAGTWLWKLQGTAWTETLKLSDRTDVKADVRPWNNLAHILLYADTSTQLVSVEYSAGTYQLWTSRPAPSSISLSGSEIATIDIDSTGRMWLATENAANEIIVYHSASPYSTWQGPVTLATGVSSDDISVVTALPGKIGVLWSNQNTQRFGFRVHDDTDNPNTWAADEVPASQAAQNVGLGMADDHLNLKVASDGTLYAAVKTSYDTAGYTKVALLVRRPSGVWDDLYHVDYGGTRGNIELDEVHGLLTYVYTQSESYNPIVYRQSALSPISFGEQQTLRSESFNDVSSTRQTYNNEIVVIYGSSSEVGGQICTGGPASGADLAITKDDGRASVAPNDPVTYTVTVTNHGPEAVTGASVTDTMPSALTAVSWTCTASGGASCTASGAGNINDTLDLPVGGSTTYRVSGTLRLGARGDLTNTAAVNAPPGVDDPAPGNNTGTDTDAIVTGGAVCESDPSLVGCWQMEESNGSVLVDGSSFNNDASLVGTPAREAGKVGMYALGLNGTSQYASVPDDSSLDMTNQITLAAWIKPERYETQSLINKAVNGGMNGYELTLATTKTDDSSRRAFFRLNQATDGDTYRINATTMYPADGTWMHIAATFDGTTMKLYINGLLEGSLIVPVGTTIATNSLPLTIGAQDGATASRWFQGWMDDVRLYDRALSAAEIQTLFGNQAPVAADDCYTVDRVEPLTIAAPGVLENDTDPEASPLSAVLVTGPSQGTLTLNVDGSFTYTPNSGFRGDDTFTYKARDGGLESAAATVTITLNDVNHSPVLDPIGNKTVNAGRLLSFTATASDVDTGDTLTFSLSGEPQGAAITSGGLFSWTPTQAQGPNTYSFDVCVSDGTAGVCETISVTVDIPGAFNKLDPPQAAILETFEVTLSWGSSADAIRYEYCLDTSVNRLCNGAWISTGTTAQVALSSLENDTTYSWQVRAVNPDGTVYADNDIWWQFTIAIPHEPGASFAARLIDNEVHGYGWPLGNSVTLTIDDPDNGAGIDYTATQTVVVADWDPNQTFVPFRVWQEDFELQPGQLVKLSDRITPKTHTITPLAITAIDPSADTVSGTAEAGSQVEVESITCRQASCSGLRHVTADGNGGWIADFAHPGSGPDEQSLVDLNAGTSGEARQADIDHDATTVPWSIQASLTVDTLGNGRVDLDPPGGRYNVDTAVQLTAAPDAGWTFAGWSGDLSGSDNPASLIMDGDKTVTATFIPLNLPPVAVDDSYATDEDVPLQIAAPGVLVNDSDTGPLTAILVSGPEQGTLTLDPDGSFTYTPAADGYGIDHFTYKASDGTLDSSVATVTITVNPLNDAPVLDVIGNKLVNAGSLLSFTATASDVDTTDILTFTLNNAPAGASITSDGAFTWTPILSQGGNSYSLEVCVSDGIDQDCETITVTVNAPLPAGFGKTSPTNGQVNVPTSLTMYWEASSGATSYEYCFATSAAGCTTWVDRGALLNVTLTDLLPGTTYYWQVRATNNDGTTYADNATLWSFRTTAAPAAFGKTVPLNGATGVGTSVILQWGASAGATKYEYCLATSLTGCTVWKKRGTQTNVSVSGLLPNTTYYWQVRATNSYGTTYADSAALWSFRTTAAPAAFGKTVPLNGATGVGTRVTLLWGTSAGTTKYEYCLATSIAGCTTWIKRGTQTSVSVNGLLPNTTYYWQVRATNSYGTTFADSATLWSFTTRP